MVESFRKPIVDAVFAGFVQAEQGQNQVLRVTTIHGPLSVTFVATTIDVNKKIRSTQFIVDDTATLGAMTTATMADLVRRTTIAAKRVANLILRPAGGDTSTIISAAGSTPIVSLTTEVQ